MGAPALPVASLNRGVRLGSGMGTYVWCGPWTSRWSTNPPRSATSLEALGMDAAVNLRPVCLASVCCLLAKILVIYYPSWPAKLLAQTCDYGRVHQQ